MRLIVENQTTQLLTIYLYDEKHKAGSVEPGGKLIIENQSLDSGRYPVIAKNIQGEIIFSETYTFMPNDKYHLQEIEERVYKAVIPPLQNK